jgi:hypothetical protein|tara:strand:+ start:93 stop:245 length:153 start_codon:yes stop_codon:yes gene_type:complete
MKIICRKCGNCITDLIPITYLTFEDIEKMQKMPCTAGGKHQMIGVEDRWY